jgi:lipase
MTLFLSRFGAGRPILCLHGIEAHGVRYLGLAQRAPGLHVVAPDLRGHGRSPMEGPWTIAQHVADLLPVLDGLGQSAILLGHSYGGLIAWELARAAPDRLAALILVDPAIAVSRELARASTDQFSLIRSRWKDEAAAFADLYAGRSAEALWSVALDVAVGLRRDADGWLRPMIAPEAPRAGWDQMQQPLAPTEWRGPTLLLEAGRENGAFTSAAVIRSMREQLGDTLTHVVLDATHTIPSDNADLLARHVSSFVAALTG